MSEQAGEAAAKRARAAWNALQLAGGVVSNADLRIKWGTPDQPLKRQTVNGVTARDDFPSPIVRGGKGAPDLWLAAEVDAWRLMHDAETRPGPRPRRETRG